MKINGIEIFIQKKPIKNMHLYVKPPHGRVEVSAPISMSDQNIEMFVRTRISWVRKQIANFANQQRQSEREYVSGETLYVWGKKYYLQVQYSNKGNALQLDGDNAVLTVRPQSSLCNEFSVKSQREPVRGGT